MPRKDRPVMKIREYTMRAKVGKGTSEEWAFTHTSQGRKLNASVRYLLNGETAGTVTCTWEHGILAVSAVAATSWTLIRVTKRGDGTRLVKFEFDNESRELEIDLKRPFPSAGIVETFDKASRKQIRRESIPASLRLLGTMNRDVLDQWRAAVVADRTAIARSSTSTEEGCQEEYDNAMEDIGGELVRDSLLIGVGLGLGWTGLGLIFAAVGMAFLVDDTEEDMDAAEEQYQECIDDAEEPA